MKFRTDFKRVKRWVSINYLLSFQSCLNFASCIFYRDVSSTSKVTTAAVCFCLVDINCFAKISLQGDQVSNCDFKFICCTNNINLFTLITVKTFIFVWRSFFIILSGKVKIDGAAFGNKWGLS